VSFSAGVGRGAPACLPIPSSIEPAGAAIQSAGATLSTPAPLSNLLPRAHLRSPPIRCIELAEADLLLPCAQAAHPLPSISFENRQHRPVWTTGSDG
jgi:hypothetical protein